MKTSQSGIRRQPGVPSQIWPASSAPLVSQPPPLPEPVLPEASPVHKQRLNHSFLKRTFGTLVVTAFILLFFYLLLETVQTVGVIMTWPMWAKIPLMLLIGGIFLYGLVKVIRVWMRFRTLPKINRMDEQELKPQLVKQLIWIQTHREGQGIREEDSIILQQVHSLLEEHRLTAHSEWLKKYKRDLQPLLENRAKEGVRKIAIQAGVAAAISPWKLLDAAIAVNAAFEAARFTLETYGIRPDSVLVTRLAVDALLLIYFSVEIEGWTEGALDSLSTEIESGLAKSALKQIGSRLAQGATLGFFVMRLGRRMRKQLVT